VKNKEEKKIVNRKINRLVISRAETDEQDENLIVMSISSEKPIQDFPGEFLILDHSSNSVRMERIETAGVGRDRHGGDQLCSVERAWLDGDKLRVAVRFSVTQRAQDIKADVLAKVRKNVSVDAQVHTAILESTGEQGDVFRAIDWEPMGFAFEPYPADITVGVGRSLEESCSLPNVGDEHPNPKAKIKRKVRNMDPEVKETAQAVSLEQLEREVRGKVEKEVRREMAETSKKEGNEKAADIMRLAKKHGCEDLGIDALSRGLSVGEFSSNLLQEIDKKQVVVGRQNPDAGKTGASEKDVERFSIMRACQKLVSGQPLDGIEAELSAEAQKTIGRAVEGPGFFLPREVVERNFDPCQMSNQFVEGLIQRGMVSRDMTANNFGQGGAWVPTIQGSFIELLRNKQVLNAMGARNLNDVQGDIEYPVQTSGSTIGTPAETGATTETNLGTGNKKATPHRLSAVVQASRQFLAQTTLDAEFLIRDDLTRQAAIKRDSLGLFGTGAGGEFLGIVNTTGVGSMTFGAAATWAKVVEMESNVDSSNALMGSLGYVTSPASKGKWKTKSKDAGSGQFIWTGNEVNGYSAMASNQIPATGTYAHRAFFGDWSDIIQHMWAGLAIIVDPYTSKANGLVDIQLEMMVDQVIRHPEALCVSTDSANQ